MNDRIKELVLSLYPEPELKNRNFGLGAQLRAVQQGIEVLDITEEWLRKEYPWEPGIRYEDIPKFVELIVQECLEACSRANEIRHFVPPTQEQVVLSCMREIENTFRS